MILVRRLNLIECPNCGDRDFREAGKPCPRCGYAFQSEDP
jgi:ribosomal protein L37E